MIEGLIFEYLFFMIDAHLPVVPDRSLSRFEMRIERETKGFSEH